MKCTEEGSKFVEVDTFGKAYTGKSRTWANDTAKAFHDEMMAKKNDYLKEVAKEFPEGTPLDEIPVSEGAGLQILTAILGQKPGRQIRGLGFGRVREMGISSSSQPSSTSTRLQQLESELEVEKVARAEMEKFEEEKAVRANMEHRLDEERAARESMMQYIQKIVHNMSSSVPEFAPPPPDFQVPQQMHGA